VVARALKTRYRGRSSFVILEDNDPTGNMSKKGLAAKTAMRLNTLKIPKRSPDLNVLDYAVWAEVEKRLRRQERKMGADKHETRAQFEQRLDRTARQLPASFINDAIGNIQKRCQLLHKAQGGLFEEGGRKRKPS
jgi:hypothetical protein